MLRVGAVILTFWAGARLLLALGILAMLLVFGKNAPVLLVLYGDISGKGVDARALATINALAVLCNAAIAAMSALSLTIIWCALVRERCGHFGLSRLLYCFCKPPVSPVIRCFSSRTCSGMRLLYPSLWSASFSPRSAFCEDLRKAQPLARVNSERFATR
jgi:hypothetical protein